MPLVSAGPPEGLKHEKILNVVRSQDPKNKFTCSLERDLIELGWEGFARDRTRYNATAVL